MLLRLRDSGKTIFLNSHLLSEVEMICDRVAILDKGQLLRIGTVEEFTSPSKTYRFATSEVSDKVASEIRSLSLEMQRQNGYLQITVANQKNLNAIIDRLRENQIAAWVSDRYVA